MSGYKRGRYLQETFGKAIKDFLSSPEILNQAVAIKYKNYLSRRKFNLVCKTQISFFNAENDVWVPRNVKCLGIDLRLPQAILDKNVVTMSIGSLTMWNLGDRVRSRDYQYLIHYVSLQEKHLVLENLWRQHTDEMALLEGNILTINGKQCTVEFQPSADMSWQIWANNEVNQTATHPSPYANVSKSNITHWEGQLDQVPKTPGNNTLIN